MMAASKERVVALSRPHGDAAERAAQPIEIGMIAGLTGAGAPQVRWPGCPGAVPVTARTQVKVTDGDIGRECTLAFAGGERRIPIVMGLLYTPGSDLDEDAPLVIHSAQSIVLHSGKARIELHADGRIDIQGLYISSQAYGPNRIKGAAVKIN